MLSIKNAAVQDIPLIRELAMEIWPQTYTPILGDKQVAYMLQLFYSPEVLERQMLQGQQFIVCYNNDVPAAFAAWEETEPRVFKLHKIYILSGQQRAGVGRYMIGYIVNALRSNGAAALRLNVNRYNYPAIAFYEKMGFIHYLDEDIYIGSGYFMNDHVLTLSIGQQ